MVAHLILVKLKEEASAEAKAGLVDALKKLSDIPGVTHCTAGEVFSARNDGYGIACAMHFIDQASLDAYGPHPLHQDMVQNHLRPNMTGVALVDYNC